MTYDLEIELSDEGKPKKIRSKSITKEELAAMFKKHDEEMNKKMESMCDACSHHECECPEKIDALDNYTETRMNKLDENDELLRQNINKLADVTDEQIRRIADESKGTLEALSKSAAELEEMKAMLDEEHRLRVAAEEKVGVMDGQITELSNDNAEMWERVDDMKKENHRFANQNLGMGIMMAVAVSISMILIGCVIAGVI